MIFNYFLKAGELEAAKAATEKKSGSKDNNVALVAIPVRLCYCLRICVSLSVCVCGAPLCVRVSVCMLNLFYCP
jgi:hypothetical protein